MGAFTVMSNFCHLLMHFLSFCCYVSLCLLRSLCLSMIVKPHYYGKVAVWILIKNFSELVRFVLFVFFSTIGIFW